MVWLAPTAGVVAGLVAGVLLVFIASAGQARRTDVERSHAPLYLGPLAAAAVGTLAAVADRVAASTAVFCASVAIAEVILIWHFLPWLVRDAEGAGSAGGESVRVLGSRAPGPVAVRAALGLLVVLAFLMFGLGAAWARGAQQIPSPVPWLVVSVFLALGLMFAERVGSLQRSARQGNLAMPVGCHWKWTAAAVALLALAAALASVTPWKPRSERSDSARAGDASVNTSPQSPIGRPEVRETAASGRSHMARIGAAIASRPRGILALWLLLILLLAALILIWAFRRSRAARRVVRAVARIVAWVVRALAWARACLRRLLDRRSKEAGEDEPTADEARSGPLFDPFEDLEVLSSLSPREVIIQTYHLALDFADMLGAGRHPGQTPFEYAQVLARAAPAARESVTTLTWAYAGAMYGGGIAAVPDPSSIRDTWQRIRAALTAGMPPHDLALRRRAYLAARALDRSR
jgi:hypothetical protein